MVSVEFQIESERIQVKALPLNVEVDIIPFVGSPENWLCFLCWNTAFPGQDQPK